MNNFREPRFRSIWIFQFQCFPENLWATHLVSALLFSAGGSTAVCCRASSGGAAPVAEGGGDGTSSSAFFENIDVSDDTWFVIPENIVRVFLVSFTKECYILLFHFRSFYFSPQTFYQNLKIANFSLFRLLISLLLQFLHTNPLNSRLQTPTDDECGS